MTETREFYSDASCVLRAINIYQGTPWPLWEPAPPGSGTPYNSKTGAYMLVRRMDGLHLLRFTDRHGNTHDPYGLNPMTDGEAHHFVLGIYHGIEMMLTNQHDQPGHVFSHHDLLNARIACKPLDALAQHDPDNPPPDVPPPRKRNDRRAPTRARTKGTVTPPPDKPIPPNRSGRKYRPRKKYM